MLFQHIIHNVIIKANFKNHFFFKHSSVLEKKTTHNTIKWFGGKYMYIYALLHWEHATKGGHFGLQVQSCCMQTVGSLPPPKSIWVIPGSLGVLGIEEVGVGPLKSDFFFTEFSNRTLRVTKHLFIRIEEFDTNYSSLSIELKNMKFMSPNFIMYIIQMNAKTKFCFTLILNLYIHRGIKFI